GGGGRGGVVLVGGWGGGLGAKLAGGVAVDGGAEDLLCLALGVGRVLCELDPAGLAAATGQDLRLDDDLTLELFGGGAGLGGRSRQPALRDPESQAPGHTP